MSAFDDEFGLFGDEAGEDEERKSTLGARTISSGETIIDEIEPEDERPARRRPRGGEPFVAIPGAVAAPGGDRRPFRRREPVKRDPLPDDIAHPRAVELLTFLAKRLVGKPDSVFVELHPDHRGAVLELEVDPDDLGKVIGRGGRVAQALRTIVRAGAEGRVTVDIVDSDDDDADTDADDVLAQHEPSISDATTVAVATVPTDDDAAANRVDAIAETDAATKPKAKRGSKSAKTTAAKPAVKKAASTTAKAKKPTKKTKATEEDPA